MRTITLAQALSDIINELDASYAPSRQLIQQQIDAIPASTQAQQQGLQAQEQQSYQDITNGARDKGIGFSGIPLQEQAQYNATTYLPALANLQASANQQKTSLLGSLNDIGLDETKTANSLYQDELDRDEQAQEAAEQAAAANQSNAALASLFGGGGSGATAPAAAMTQRSDKGFNFTSSNGTPISAAAYSQLKGIPLRTLLQQMANAGDSGAATALNYVGNDYGYNPTKVAANPSIAALLNSILDGVNTVKTSNSGGGSGW